MPRLSVLPSIASLVLLGFALSGCERGCASSWMKTRKKGAEGLSAPFGPALDCPDGLGRCVGGVVEASRIARIPLPCSKNEGPEGTQGSAAGCACPWNAVADCPRGCAVEGVTIVVTPEHAAGRLCAPDPANPVARPAPAAVASPGACDGDARGYRCLASLVVACEPSDATPATTTARVVAACVRGCAHDGDAVGAEETDADGATRILCAH